MGYHLGGKQLAGEQVRSAPGKAMRLKSQPLTGLPSNPLSPTSWPFVDDDVMLKLTSYRDLWTTLAGLGLTHQIIEPGQEMALY